MSKTIDSLGIEDHRRFATSKKNHEAFKHHLTQPSVAHQVTIINTDISLPSSVETLVGKQEGTTWALFPLRQEGYRGSAFTKHLLAFLANEEKIEKTLADLKELLHTLEMQKKTSLFNETRKIFTAIERFIVLADLHVQTTSRVGQYHKG